MSAADAARALLDIATRVGRGEAQLEFAVETLTLLRGVTTEQLVRDIADDAIAFLTGPQSP
jgi:hypothetical protein